MDSLYEEVSGLDVFIRMFDGEVVQYFAGEKWSEANPFNWSVSNLKDGDFKFRVKRPTETLTKDERVIWFEKFIGGERVQYRVKDTQQWHNMTFKSLVIFDHKDLEFRNAPTVVEIDGFNFHSKESLLKYIDNNYQLD